MARIDPVVLRKLRLAKGFSHADLATETEKYGPKIDPKTIWRIERGDQETTRARIIHQIARALNTTERVLTGQEAMQGEYTADATISELQMEISTLARNALYLVAERYG